MLQTIADPADCGKLYLCEISATSSQLLTQYEAETVQMFKRTYKANVRAKRDKNISLDTQKYLLQSSKTTSPRRGYDTAWRVGRRHRDVSACRRRFPRCEVTNIVTMVRSGLATL